jgi:hypothetical protein
VAAAFAGGGAAASGVLWFGLVQGSGFRVQGSGFRVEGSRVRGPRFGVWVWVITASQNTGA